nr:translation initiation factor IF-2 [Oryctolagus cuniculus]
MPSAFTLPVLHAPDPCESGTENKGTVFLLIATKQSQSGHAYFFEDEPNLTTARRAGSDARPRRGEARLVRPSARRWPAAGRPSTGDGGARVACPAALGGPAGAQAGREFLSRAVVSPEAESRERGEVGTTPFLPSPPLALLCPTTPPGARGRRFREPRASPLRATGRARTRILGLEQRPLPQTRPRAGAADGGPRGWSRVSAPASAESGLRRAPRPRQRLSWAGGGPGGRGLSGPPFSSPLPPSGRRQKGSQRLRRPGGLRAPPWGVCGLERRAPTCVPLGAGSSRSSKARASNVRKNTE